MWMWMMGYGEEGGVRDGGRMGRGMGRGMREI